MSEDRWRNIEITILCPSPDGPYAHHQDLRFDELSEAVFKLYPEAVMGNKLVWSDEDSAA